jgi:hypothetical protein
MNKMNRGGTEDTEINSSRALRAHYLFSVLSVYRW